MACRRTATALGLCLVALLHGGCTPSPGPEIEVTEARIRAPLPGRDMTAGYFNLTNRGDAALILTGASSPAVRAVEIHQTVADGDMMRMRRLDEVVVSPGETVRFEPGGRHLMLFGVEELGASTDVALTRRHGEPIVVPFTVVAVTDS